MKKPRASRRSSGLLRLLRFLPLPLVWSACGGSEAITWPETLDLVHSTFPEVEQLATEELAQWLDDPERRQPLLLDAREAAEFAVSHLPGARRISPDASDAERVLEGVASDQPIVVYCSVGYRSSSIARTLDERGFTDVRNLDGSIFAWANEGRSLERDGEPAQVVHPFDDRWGVLLDRRLHPSQAD